MYKSIKLTSPNNDGTDSTAHVLIYDDIRQLEDFCNTLNITAEDSSFRFVSIDKRNKAYIIRTKPTDTEDSVKAVTVLETVKSYVNHYGNESLLGSNRQWHASYIARQLGIDISWKQGTTAQA